MDIPSNIENLNRLNAFLKLCEEGRLTVDDMEPLRQFLVQHMSDSFSYDEKNQAGGRALRTPKGQARFIEYQTRVNDIFSEVIDLKIFFPLRLFAIETSFEDIFTPDEARAQEVRMSTTFNRALLQLIHEEHHEQITFPVFLRVVREYFRVACLDPLINEHYRRYMDERLPLAWAMKYEPILAADYFNTRDPHCFDGLRDIMDAPVAMLLPQDEVDGGIVFEAMRGEGRVFPDMLACRSRFEKLLMALSYKLNELERKGTQGSAHYNPNYAAAKAAAQVLFRELSMARDDFFTKARQSARDFEQFKTSCDQAIAKATPVMAAHRGLWDKISPLLRCVFGFFATLLFVGPMLSLCGVLKHGYKDTFFSCPSTDSEKQLKVFEKGAHEVFGDIAQQLP